MAKVIKQNKLISWQNFKLEVIELLAESLVNLSLIVFHSN